MSDKPIDKITSDKPVIETVAETVNGRSWKICGTVGAVCIVLFYWAYPAFTEYVLSFVKPSPYYKWTEMIVHGMAEWSEGVAIAILLICAFFAYRSLRGLQRVSLQKETRLVKVVRFISKILN